jgi:hypothetical protein
MTDQHGASSPEGATEVDAVLQGAVREIEAHAAEAG